MIILSTAIVFLLACEPSYLDEVKQSVYDESNTFQPFIFQPSVVDERSACAALKAVDYDYDSLDEQLPLRTLKTAAVQDIAYGGDSLRNNCEWNWADQSGDIVARHFSDMARVDIIATCKEWLSMSPPPSWSAFRNGLRAEYADRFPPGERARLRKLGVTFTRTDQVYRAFDKSESMIAQFCGQAVSLK